MERKDLKLVRVMPETKYKLEKLSAKKGLKQLTVLEYLLNGKINLEEFNEIK